MTKYHFIPRCLFFSLLLYAANAKGQSYSVAQVNSAYNFENLVSPSTVPVTEDDYTLISIGFDFEFFGITYSQCRIAQNGFIQFGNSPNGGCCQGGFLPSATTPNNFIAAAWTDYIGQLCCISSENYDVFQYKTIGSAPNRRFVITMNLTDDCFVPYSGQIKLFEGSNIIEIHTAYWAEFESSCTEVTQGIENSTGTEAYFHEDRNANSNWFIECCEDVMRFTPIIIPALDASVTEMLTPTQICDTQQHVSIVLENLGTDTIEEATISWTLNGVLQTPVDYSGNIFPEGDTAHITVSSPLTFSPDPDTLVFWATDLNGEDDEMPENDTLEQIYALPLNGEYTIGGVSPDFAIINAAITALELRFVCGPVTFLLRNGIYSEQFSISHIPGTSEANTITFTSESQDSSAVTIQFNSSSTYNYVVQLDGTEHVSFTHLGFKSLNTTNANVMVLAGDGSNVTVEHCKFEAPSTSSDVGYLFYTGNAFLGEFLGDLTFRNNYFLNGSRAIYLVGNSTPTLRPGNILIEENIFLNQRTNAIFASQLKDVSIQSNHVVSNTAYLISTGIHLLQSHGTNIVAFNTVNLSNQGDGIGLSTINNTTGVTGVCLVYNNMSSVLSGNAFRVAGCKYTSVYFNSAYSRGTNASEDHALEVSGGDFLTVKNNIMVANAGRTFSESFFAPNVFVDYNDLYTSGTQLARRSNTNYANLPAWQSATGLDAHSVSIYPDFVSITDLHVLSTILNAKATPISGITEDFDHQLRHVTTPDIGADEIGTETGDAGIFAILPDEPFHRGLQDVKAVLRNFGSDTLNTAVVSWTLDGVAQQDYFYSGPLTSLDHDTLILGQVEFELNTGYNIIAWSSMPNQTSDAQPENDTLINNTISPAASGIVTIGASGELMTIAAAVSAMNLGGVLDSVHFQIQPGTYHTSITFPAGAYMSCDKPIVFESTTGNATDVIWDNQGTGTHTIVLDGADGLVFRKLTINTVVTNMQVIRFQNAASCNRVSECLISGLTTTSTSTALAPVFGISTSTSNYNNQNTIEKNTISSGSYSIYWDGFNGTTGLVIKENQLINARNYAVFINRLKAPVVHGNTVSSNSAVAIFYGIRAEICTENARYTANKLLLHNKRARGIYLNDNDGTALLPVLVANNFIILGNGADCYGLHMNICTFTDVIHNTIRISGGTNTSRNIYRQSGATISLLNNILDNQGGGVAMYFDGTATPLTTNYNSHFTEGTNLIHYLGTNYTTLAAWQVTGRDLNSVYEEPVYDADEPLGFRITNSTMNDAGTPVAVVNTDIENAPRDLATPDIGCDEYNLFTHDVGLVGITYPIQPYPSGTNTVYVKFINNGAGTLTSMDVHWEVDSIPQPVYQWTGLLPSAGTYDSLDIGTFDFAPGVYHSIKAWVSQPNGVADQYDVNDTLVVDSLYPGLHGIYTIGGIDPDFETISAAVTELNRGGASDNVTFKIRTGTYLNAIVINDFPGSDCDRAVTFQAESGNAADVLITNLGIDAYTIVLNGADGVVFQDLSITSVNTAFRHVVVYSNGAHCNQFIGNIITGYQSTSTATSSSVILSSAGLDTANVFDGNLIEHGSYSFYLQGSVAASRTTLLNNVLHPYYRGVFASSEYGLIIDDNEITCPNLSGQGIDLDDCHNLVSISRNKIHMPNGQYGLALSNCDALSSSPALIANNFINVGGSGTARTVYLSGCSWYDIQHNNLHAYSSNSSQSQTAALYLNSSPSVTAKNNVLSNIGPGYTIYSNNNTGFISDYNCFHFAGDYVGFWNGGAVIDFETWQAIEGRDAHSFVENPQFMSDEDLHVSNVLLNGAGEFSSLVTNDVDGDIRNNPPDIGADEFDPAIANDAGAFMYIGPIAPFAAGSQPLSIVVKNYGADTLETVDVRWLVNGLEQPVYHWTGNLPSAQCDTVIIGNYPFAPITDHDLLFWTEMPNTVQDSAQVNDTLAVDDIYPALAGTYTVGGTLPHFNLFSQLEKALDKGGILNDVTFEIRNGTYHAQFAIKDFPRASYADYVNFTSESGDSSSVTIERNFTSLDNYTVLLMNAHGIRFENVTLNSTKGIVVEMTAGSSDIRIANCSLTGVNLGVDNAHYAVISSATTTEDSIVITNNLIEEGDYGIYMIGSSGSPERHMVISNNTFLNNKTTSIYTRYTHGLTVQNNSIVSTEDEPDGMFIYDAVASPVISGNDIRLMLGGTYGIRLYQVHGTAMLPAKVYNNYILSRNAENHTTFGIDQEDCNYVNHSYNTVRLEAGSGSVNFRDDGSLHNIHVRNCNFANYGGGRTMHNGWTDLYSSNTVNHCNLYTTGATLVYFFIDYADLTALQVGEDQNLQGVSAEPLFADDSPNVYQAALDSAGIPISGITTDITGAVRNTTTPDIGAKEFTLLAHDIGPRLLSAPETYCGLSASEEIVMRIQNFGSNAETGFNVSYAFNGGSWVTENVGSLIVQPGQAADFEFTVPQDLSDVGSYTFSLRTSLAGDLNAENDTLWDIEVIHIPELVDAPDNLLPSDNTIDVDKPVNLSWAPAPNATRYDVYVWEEGDTEPMNPQLNGLQQINNSYNSISYAGVYQWKVVSRNTCDQSVSSPIQQFTVRSLPDLVVDTVIAPVNGFTGQPIEVQWVVQNTGTGVTGDAQWSDAVYLSADATLSTSLDIYLGSVKNLTALDHGEEYLHEATFTVPNNTVGNYYLFVYSDRFTDVIESSNGNNWTRSPAVSMIQLSPLPDLRVIDIAPPLLAFSGEIINLQYTVENNGSAATGLKTWRDQVQLSSIAENPDGPVIGTFYRTMNLASDATYTETVAVTLPEGIFGEYYLFVHTDVHNAVYEFAAEQNNVMSSDTFDILLSPPADLIITEINIPDTISSDFYNNLSWTVANQGAGSTEAQQWKDEIYISPAPVFNPNFNIVFSHKYRTQQVGSLGSYVSSAYSKSLALPTGHYYIYGVTDVLKAEYEYNQESNNQYTHPEQVFLGNPDLLIEDLSYPDTVDGTSLFSIGWNQRNVGYGQYSNKTMLTRMYASPSSVFDIEDAVLLREEYKSSQSMTAGDTVVKTTSLAFPPSVYGDVYLHLHINANAAVYESPGDSNNVCTSINPIYVIEPPVPDIEVVDLEIPDTATAGVTFVLEYITANTGFDESSPVWTDQVFISFDTVWNPDHAVQLSEVAHNSLLEIAHSIQTPVAVTLDPATTGNVYYIYIHSDIDDDIYEGSGELNNLFRSDPFYVKGAPVVDLAIDTIVTGDGPFLSGTSYPVSWVTEIVNNTIPVAQYWSDRAYLSLDQDLNTTVDISVGVYAMGLDADLLPTETYEKEAFISIPHGVSGDYYLFVESDYGFAHHDTSRQNNIALLLDDNGDPEILHVMLAPSPDLVVSSFEAPVAVYGNQTFEIELCIHNNGNQAAYGSWINQIYLSPNPTISNHDLRLSSFNASGIAADSTSCYTLHVAIPVAYSGNYYLISCIDALGNVYEHGGEQNNEVLRSVDVVMPLPSDLVVQDVIVPLEATAGEVIEVSWATQNIGPNPVYGGYREIVYLSEDTTWSIADPIFGVKDTSTYIPPLSVVQNTFTDQVKDVTEGEYYAIVRTDVQQQIIESSDANNTGISADQMEVEVKTLVFDSLTLDSLHGNLVLYYKIEIPPGYEDESVLITLQGDSASGRNELYAKFEGIPTRGDYEFGPQQPTGAYQHLIIPSAQVGFYYITAYGYTFEGDPQEVELFATIIPFEILSISPNQGVRHKKVTVEIRGAKLDEADIFRLRRTQPWVQRIAESVYVVNENLVYATFDLTGIALDTYQLDGITTDNALAIAPQDFIVIEEGEPDLQFNVEGASEYTTLRVPRKLTITFKNSGAADVTNAILEVHAPYGNRMSDSPQILRSGGGSEFIEFLLQEPNGPPGIVRPGAGGTIEMFMISQPAPTFIFKLKDQ